VHRADPPEAAGKTRSEPKLRKKSVGEIKTHATNLAREWQLRQRTSPVPFRSGDPGIQTAEKRYERTIPCFENQVVPTDHRPAPWWGRCRDRGLAAVVLELFGGGRVSVGVAQLGNLKPGLTNKSLRGYVRRSRWLRPRARDWRSLRHRGVTRREHHGLLRGKPIRPWSARQRADVALGTTSALAQPV